MARQATGQVVVRERQAGRLYALRFRAYGRRHYLTLGTDSEGWDRRRAEEELENVLADARRGIWKPQERSEPVEPTPEPTFHEFASEWFAARKPELAERTVVDYRWRLTNHLLPYFAEHRLSQITIEEVDRYRQRKIAEREKVKRMAEAARARGERYGQRPLSNSSINMTITLLAAILESAVEYRHLAANPARGRRRRLKQPEPTRTYLSPAQVEALLAAAAELDVEVGDSGRRRPLLATLCLAGLRIGEALALRWRHVDLAAGSLRVVGAKTDAGVRQVDLTPALRELLSEYRTRSAFAASDDHVFPTREGRADNASNVRNRLLADAIERANAALADEGVPIAEGVSPHSLRRTYISILLAAGADPRYVMRQVGHRDPSTTLRIYAQVIERERHHGAQVDELVGAADWAPLGTTMAEELLEEGDDPRSDTQKPRRSGASERADDGTRTHDLLHGKQTL